MFLLFSSIFDQDLCFPIEREGLLISFICCRICFQILFEGTFSILFYLSRCSCAENFCNLHAIIAILLPFLHNILCLSSVHLPLFILLFRKLAGATCANPKEAGIENKLQWQVIEKQVMTNNKN
jgi:hypothetical protein